MQSSSLDALERNAYRDIVDHGYFDLLAGLFLLGFGLVIALDQPWLALINIAVVVAGKFGAARFLERVVAPRTGVVRLSPTRLDELANHKKSIVLAFFVAVLVLGRFEEAAWFPEVLARNPELQLGLVTAGAFALVAWLFRLWRFFLYGGLIAIAPAVQAGSGLPAGTGWIVAAVTVLLAGVLVLATFLRANPLEGSG